MMIQVNLELNERTLKFLESEGYRIYAEKTSEGHSMPKISRALSEDVAEKEAIVRCTGNDCDITFNSQIEAEQWRNDIAMMLEEGGYHLSREKPEKVAESDE